MKAYVSGSAGATIVQNDDSLVCYFADEPDELVNIQPEDFHRIFQGARDLAIYDCSTLDEAKTAFDKALDCSEALNLTLGLIDPELSEKLRHEIAEELENMFSHEHVVSYVQNAMWAHELPQQASIEDVRRICGTAGATNVTGFFDNLLEHQPFINEVRIAWDAIPPSAFVSENDRHFARFIAIQNGLFFELSHIREKAGDVNNFLLKSLILFKWKQVKNYKLFLNNWVRDFKTKSTTKAQDWEQLESEEIKSDGTKKRKPRCSSGNIKQSAGEKLKKVEKQKNAIICALKNRDYKNYKKFLSGLIDHQIKSKPEYLCKSLCDLAMEAKLLHQYEIQLELTEKSIEINPDDAWAWRQYGDALLNTRRLYEALQAFINSQKICDNVVARNGCAETLRALGRISDALVVYEETIKLFPNEVVPRCGRAETLRTLGRIPDALVVYEETIKLFPIEVVPRCGRAETLRAMGRITDALDAYEETIKLFPDNVVARNGHAETLRAIGRITNALHAYEETIKLFPCEVVPRSGRAETLRAMGRIPDALHAYEETIQLFPGEVVPRCGRAETLRTMGRITDALHAYEETIKLFPGDVVPRSGRAETLRALGRIPDALHAYEETIQLFPNDVFAKNGRAETLRTMGRITDALLAYEETIRLFPGEVVPRNGRAETLRALGRIPDALHAYEESIQLFPGEVVARCGRAETLRAMGRIPDALLAYEETIQLFPGEVVARNGRACILVTINREEEALSSLEINNPRYIQEWIGYHIKGMINIKMQQFAEAHRIFEEGVENCPWAAQKDYFRTALAMVNIREKMFSQAHDILAQINTHNLNPTVHLLSVHALGENGDTDNARIVFKNINLQNADPCSIEISEELRRRFISNEQPLHDDSWLMEKEFECLFHLSLAA